MASSISPLSYLDPSAYTSAIPQPAANPATSDAAAASDSSQTSGPSAVVQLQALQKQGDLQAYLSNSVAAALLQPAPGSSSTDSATLINNMLQQVLGAYNAQSSTAPSNPAPVNPPQSGTAPSSASSA